MPPEDNPNTNGEGEGAEGSTPEQELESIKSELGDLKREKEELEGRLEDASIALSDPDVIAALGYVKQQRMRPAEKPVESQPKADAKGGAAPGTVTLEQLNEVLAEFGKQVVGAVGANLTAYGQVTDLRDELIAANEVSRKDWREIYVPQMQEVFKRHPSLSPKDMFEMAKKELAAAGKVKPSEDQGKGKTKPKFFVSERPDESIKAPAKSKSYTNPRRGGGKDVDFAKHARDAAAELGIDIGE